MAGDIVLDLDVGSDIDAMTAHLAGLESKISQAVRRALNKVARWLRTHSLREVGKAVRIPLKALKERFKVFSVNKGGEKTVKLWVGLLSLAADQVGPVRQNASGVSVRGRQFDSAFIAGMNSRQSEYVFIRSRRNDQLKHETYGSEYRYKYAKDQIKNAERFPLQRVGIAYEDLADPVLNRYETRVNSRFRELLDQELNYVLNHAV